MPSPLKSFKRIFTKKSGEKTEQPSYTTYPRLEILWPYGTWNFDPARDARHNNDMDINMQAAILDSWAREQYQAAVDRAGYELNPGMFGCYPPPIPDDWLPSEKGMKALFAKNKWRVDYMHYMVAQLQSLKHLRP